MCIVADARAEEPKTSSAVWFGGEGRVGLGSASMGVNARASVVGDVWLHPNIGIGAELGGLSGAGSGYPSFNSLFVAPHGSARVCVETWNHGGAYFYVALGAGWIRYSLYSGDGPAVSQASTVVVDGRFGAIAQWRFLFGGGMLGATGVPGLGVGFTLGLRTGVAF